MLDPDQVLGIVVDAVIGLGFEAANLCVYDDDVSTYRVVSPRGLPEEYAEGVHPASGGMSGMVLASDLSGADRVIIYSDGRVTDEQGEPLGNLHDED